MNKPIYCVFEHCKFPSGNVVVTLFHACATKAIAESRKAQAQEWAAKETTKLVLEYRVVEICLESEEEI